MAGAVLALLLKQRGDLGEAESWMRQAAEAGNADAANDLRSSRSEGGT
ncbi:hypothetical protein AB0D12_21595 [Streptomyces sp. NPDC048479]